MKPTILFITPGPTIGVHSAFTRVITGRFPKKYRGYIVTTSYERGELSIGEFTYLPMKFTPSRLRALKFVLSCVWRALVLRARKQRVDLVSTYDPLLTGFIGVITSRILGARLALEVNGVYTSPFQWVDAPDTLGTTIKRRLYPAVMRFVLKRSHGVRLLFPGQLGLLEDAARGKVIRAFPCFVPTDQFREIEENKEVFFAGFPFRLKGIDVLITAFRQIAPRYPDWKLKILGWFPDPGELYDAIGGHPQIFHHKPVHHSEMVEHIGSAPSWCSRREPRRWAGCWSRRWRRPSRGSAPMSRASPM